MNKQITEDTREAACLTPSSTYKITIKNAKIFLKFLFADAKYHWSHWIWNTETCKKKSYKYCLTWEKQSCLRRTRKAALSRLKALKVCRHSEAWLCSAADVQNQHREAAVPAQGGFWRHHGSWIPLAGERCLSAARLTQKWWAGRRRQRGKQHVLFTAMLLQGDAVWYDLMATHT